ncbi:MAG: hypothetical protein M3Q48_09975 [Actinomycetota bacterium]|nr:hypothetical protein [Actinomycetota bacterium]
MPMLKPLLGALGVTLALAAPAVAQTTAPYPGTTSTTAAVSTATQVAGTLAVGQTTTITSCPFRPGPVNLAVNAQPAGTDTAEADGCARTTVAVLGVNLVRVEGTQVAARCGDNTLAVTGPGAATATRTVNTVFGIDCPAAPAATAGGALPRTGAMILRWSLAGAALLAVGWLIVLADRRRRIPTAP